MSETTTPTSEPVETISLYYRDSGSDKIYNASIMPSGEGFLVNFSFGRRGAALTAGTKTTVPVSREKAQTIFDKLVAEKTSKGYTRQEGGQLFADSADMGRVTGNVPQLLNDATEAELMALLAEDDWALQTKHDGRRTMIHRLEAGVTGSNRRGLVVALPQELHDCLLTLPLDTVLDGELIGVTLHVFDSTRWGGADLTDLSYKDRLTTLTRGLESAEYVRLVETSQGQEEKAAHLERVRSSRGEGVVLKRLSAPYRAGRPSSGGNQRKFKFTQSVTCRVLEISDKKRSIVVGVLTSDTEDKTCGVGSVTISPNFTVPPVGALVEVRYLYYYEGGSLYQPVYLGERDDKTTPDTHISLKRKQNDEEE